MDDLFGDRPKTTPSAGKKRGASSILQDMIQKDDRDWLDMAAGSEASRPRTAPEPKKQQETPARGRAATGTDKPGV